MQAPCVIFTILCFIFSTFIGYGSAFASSSFVLPKPGERVGLSAPYHPAILRGLKVHPENPFKFEFILDQGDANNLLDARSYKLKAGKEKDNNKISLQRIASSQEDLKNEANKLIKYFLASLTVPEKDLWVNLSPYEKDRIIPNAFGQTEMGRDLLAQDYLLKQVTASLMYPQEAMGKKFWQRIYQEAAQRYGTTTVPVNTFNKVWIVPDKAVVYNNGKAQTAYVMESRLKVMLEDDYLAIAKTKDHRPQTIDPQGNRQPGDMFPSKQQNVSPRRLPTSQAMNAQASQGGNLSQDIIRELILPELEKEVNEGRNFAPLRQVYNSLILATWYKKKIKDSILNQVYANKNKIQGAEYQHSFIQEPPAKGNVQKRTSKNASLQTGRFGSGQVNDIESIYQNYIKAFKKGVYNYIKNEPDPTTRQPIPRKYFSGGAQLIDVDRAMKTGEYNIQSQGRDLVRFDVELSPTTVTQDEKLVRNPEEGSVGVFYLLEGRNKETGSIDYREWLEEYPSWNLKRALEVHPDEIVRRKGEYGSGQNWDYYKKNQRMLRKEFLRFLLIISNREFDFEDPDLYDVDRWEEEDTKLEDSWRSVKDIPLSPRIGIKDFIRVLRFLHKISMFGLDNQSPYQPPTNQDYPEIRSAAVHSNQVFKRFDYYVRHATGLNNLEKEDFVKSVRRFQSMLRIIYDLRESGKMARRNVVATISYSMQLYETAMQDRRWIFIDGYASNSFFMNLTNCFIDALELNGISHGHMEAFFEPQQGLEDAFIAEFVRRLRETNTANHDQIPSYDDVLRFRSKVRKNPSERKGGIDLTSAQMDVKMETDSRLPRNGHGIGFQIDPAMIKRWQEAPGVEVVIVDMVPLKDLRGFLGAGS